MFFHERNDLRSVFGLSLKLYVALVNLGLLCMVCVNIPLVVVGNHHAGTGVDMSDGFRLATYSLQGFIAVVGLFSCLFGFPLGLAWSLASFNAVIGALIIDALAQVLALAVTHLSKDPDTPPVAVLDLTLRILWLVIALPLSNTTKSAISSLLHVLAVGGTGSEKKNYKQLRNI